MDAAALLVLGAVLCFFGTRSLRIAVLVGGAGAAWLLADALGASNTTTVLVAVAGALGAFVISLLVSSFVFFVGGLVVGAVVGSKLYVLADSGTGDGEGGWLLALVFVPAVALVCGFLASRFRKRFLSWGTALAGAALILSGLGELGSNTTDDFWRPESGAGAVTLTVLWLGLALVGHRVQGGGGFSRRPRPVTPSG
jgi:hypothetical protein